MSTDSVFSRVTEGETMEPSTEETRSRMKAKSAQKMAQELLEIRRERGQDFNSFRHQKVTICLAIMIDLLLYNLYPILLLPFYLYPHFTVILSDSSHSPKNWPLDLNPVSFDFSFNFQVDDDGKIIDAKFKTSGYGSGSASSSLATEMMTGKPTGDAQKIRNTDIAQVNAQKSFDIIN